MSGHIEIIAAKLIAVRNGKIRRLVINLPRLMASPIGSQYDVVLRDGDELIVPKLRQRGLAPAPTSASATPELLPGR